MKKKCNLMPPATKTGWVTVEVLEAADGGYCLVMNNTRVAGCDVALRENNVYWRWNVREEFIQQVLDNLKKAANESR